MAAPLVLDNDTVSSLHQALGLNDIVNSISHLSSLVKSTLKRKSSDKDESSKKRFRPDDDVAFEQQHESSDDGNGSEE
jgi:CO dehydrogenase nickel-insertion accessory protein CooC1